MVQHVIKIPNWRPANLNSLFRCHWSVRNRKKKADAQMIQAYAMAIPKATGKRRVGLHIVLHGSQQAADPDAYWKSLLDGLVKCSLLVDDSSQYCELSPPTYERGKKSYSGTTIILEDL